MPVIRLKAREACVASAKPGKSTMKARSVGPHQGVNLMDFAAQTFNQAQAFSVRSPLTPFKASGVYLKVRIKILLST
jgi:hypothetical protein